MKVLVSGAEGFVGRAIVDEILENKFQIYQLANVKPWSIKIKKDENIYRVDISNYENLSAAFETVELDVFIHSAGLAHKFGKQKKEDFWKINVLGTENAAKLAVFTKARHFVLISSVAVYGSQTTKSKGSNPETKGITETAECNPQGTYAASKFESERIAKRICEENGIALTILRLTTVTGEGDKGNVARLINAIDGKRFVWIGNGDNLKSLIYKGDVAKACIKVIGRTDGTQIYNITGETVKMKRIVAEICERLGEKMPKLMIPPEMFNRIFELNNKIFKIRKLENLAVTLNKWLSDDVFSGEKFNAAYNFRPETSFSEAIARQVEFHRKLK
jgi:nucleoside-diphosphate-sugar epimerase